MNEMISFLVKSVLCSGVLFGYYWLALRNQLMHSYNRFYLLSIIAVSLVIPLLHFHIPVSHSHQAIITTHMLSVVSSGLDEKVTVINHVSGINWAAIILTIYAAVSFVLLLVLLKGLLKLRGIRKGTDKVKMEGYRIVYTDVANAPFSFFNTIYWNRAIDINSKEGRQILDHELVHVRQKHSLDKLFLQFVLIACWINPFYWLIQKELSMVHEFIADEHSVSENDTESFARMLLASHYPNVLQHIVQPFFFSPIKRRLIMLTKTARSNYAMMRKLVAVPVATASLALLSFKTNTPVVKATHPMVLVVDAGHGGDDNGTVNGTVKEKDLTLQVAQRLQKMAAEYNISVLLTRNNDNSMALEDRVGKSNAAQADLFLSIHINDANSKEGRELIVSSKNSHYTESKRFASLMSAQLGRTNGQLTDKGLVVLKGNKWPAVAIECGAINDPKTLAMFNDEKQLDNFCKGILNSVVAYGK